MSVDLSVSMRVFPSDIMQSDELNNFKTEVSSIGKYIDKQYERVFDLNMIYPLPKELRYGEINDLSENYDKIEEHWGCMNVWGAELHYEPRTHSDPRMLWYTFYISRKYEMPIQVVNTVLHRYQKLTFFFNTKDEDDTYEIFKCVKGRVISSIRFNDTEPETYYTWKLRTI